MTAQPLVSVIIIFLNAEEFIHEAIESVFAQTYECWELLLVDDGSTDASTAIAQGYAKDNPGRVRYLEHAGHANRGMSTSRNLGMDHARGEYIAFLDADDVWLPHKLDRQVAVLAAHPEAAMVYGLSQWWYSWTGKPEDRKRDFTQDLGLQPNTVFQPPELLSPFFFRQEAAIPCPSNILIRRSVTRRVGGFEDYFSQSYKQAYEDQAFYAKLILAAPIIAINERWDRYRQHPNSFVTLAQRRGEAHAARLSFLTWLKAYLAQQGVRDRKIRRDLQKALWATRYPLLHRLLRRRKHMAQRARSVVLRPARRLLPDPVRVWLLARWKRRAYVPPIGWVRFGSLRRLAPLSRTWGYDRGRPVDRYYIERFLAEHAQEVKGRVLEVADDAYTRQFGSERVTQSDVLDVSEGNPKATVISDLTRGEEIPADAFDCVVLTQTLQLIYDVPAALRTLYRILKPGGVALVTVPGISQISRYDMDRWGHFWNFTTLSVRRLFEEVFPAAAIEIEAHGNVLAATAFLYGLAAQELRQAELDHVDPDYEVIITIKAVKPSTA